MKTAASDRIPTLDGWRGLAIALVLIDHIQDAVLHRYARPWTQTGQHGVTIFFVLSGFLITSKLLEGPIDLRRFYVRRLFRLMPAAWVYLGALLLISGMARHWIISLAAIRACVFFYRNFAIPLDTGITGHFWSLSVEEQFYLVWPCILLLAGARRCRWIAATGAFACACYRWLRWAHYNHDPTFGHTEVRADALLVGCLLALLLQDADIRAWAARWSRVWALPALATLAFCIARFHWLAPLCESVCIAALITASVLHPHSPVTRPLSSAALVWLGAVSYSIYVWQELFMRLAKNSGNSTVAIGLLCLALPVFALCSYYLIERPATRLGHRLTRRRPLLAGSASQELPEPLYVETAASEALP